MIVEAFARKNYITMNNSTYPSSVIFGACRKNIEDKFYYANASCLQCCTRMAFTIISFGKT